MNITIGSRYLDSTEPGRSAEVIGFGDAHHCDTCYCERLIGIRYIYPGTPQHHLLSNVREGAFRARFTKEPEIP